MAATSILWKDVATARLTLADIAATVPDDQWDSESACSGWRIRDVLGHLVYLAEATQASVAYDFVRHRLSPSRMLRLTCIERGQADPASLARRLKMAVNGRFHVVGSPPAVAYGEVVVHTDDILRPLGRFEMVNPESLLPVLDAYRRIAQIAFGSTVAKSRRLVATDVAWSFGQGNELNASGQELVLLLANRRTAEDLTQGGS